jgi:leader peptidase (prepilin peptidase)/N-methyltransferase
MNPLNFLAEFPLIFSTLAGVIGLLVGSFLNVVIYRLPLMMQQNWRKECSDYLQLPGEQYTSEPFNLALPPSRCPHCQAPIKAYQNIPVVSYLFLGGKCAHCKTAISLRYPFVEAFTGIISLIVAIHFGYGPQTFFALALSWSLIALSFIDFDHHLLPDSITLPLVWLGLFLSLFSLYTDAHASIIGAISGYLTLWTVYQLFKLATGKEGMGYGDFKLLAVFGAWLGWQYLPIIILLSSLLGALVGILMIITARQDRHQPIPFGPYLAIAGWIALIFGESINQAYLSAVGL